MATFRETDLIVIETSSGENHKLTMAELRELMAYGLVETAPGTNSTPRDLSWMLRMGDGLTAGLNVTPDGGGSNTYMRISANKKRQLIPNSGRVYAYTNLRWVTDSDDNYGSSYYQWAESGGTGVEPIVEFEHMGFYVPEGTTLDKLNILMRATSLEVTDCKLRVVFREPNPVTRWTSGMDNDAEMTNTVLFSGNFIESAMGGNMVDIRRKIIEFKAPNGVDPLTLQNAGYLSLYFKPTGTLTRTRHIRTNLTWELLS